MKEKNNRALIDKLKYLENRKRAGRKDMYRSAIAKEEKKDEQQDEDIAILRKQKYLED